MKKKNLESKKNLQLHYNCIACGSQEEACSRDDVWMIEDGQNLEFFLSLFADLFPSVDELDGDLVTTKNLLAPADDRKSASTEFLKLDVPPLEVPLPARVQVRGRALKTEQNKFKGKSTNDVITFHGDRNVWKYRFPSLFVVVTFLRHSDLQLPTF